VIPAGRFRMSRRRTVPLDAPAVASRPRRLGPDDAVQYLRGVGPARAALLARLGIRTVRDLLLHLPRRYEDRRHPTPLALLREGVAQAAIVRIERVQLLRTRRGIPIVRAAVVDATGAALAIWFHQPYLATTLARGQQVSLYGRVERAGRTLQFVAPEFEVLDPHSDPLHVGRLVPIYPTTEGLPQRTLRILVRDALVACADAVPDVLPAELRARYDLLPVRDALWAVHFPEHADAAVAARRRLAFEELLVLRLGVLEQRRVLRCIPRSATYATPGPLLERFVASLPYPLTGAQRRVIDEILRDMRGPVPMNRLLQGDVGSGKTVVAAAALVACVAGGAQGALMAPTEILAEQHYLTLRQLLAPLDVPVVLLTGGADPAVRQVALARLAAGDPLVVVGTHALLEEGVTFARLGLAVIDEQHRFGVMQRARLRAKGAAPDVLVMTATPIPRTLTLTLYGDLDTSVLDELPPGRQPVATYVRPTAARAKVYAWLRQQVAGGRQAYVVCPLIEESETVQAASAVRLAQELREGPLAGLRLEVLHGRLPAAARAERMEAFRAGAIDVLVATTVIEVGIDVPNATIMVIENADRYGLAQLHQLRGRVGRGVHRGTCILLADPTTEEGRRRLEVMATVHDGFRIAQEDLAIRGPGEVLGTRQHGATGLRVADLVADVGVLEEASAAAEALLARDPTLVGADVAPLAELVRQRLRERAGLASVG